MHTSLERVPGPNQAGTLWKRTLCVAGVLLGVASTARAADPRITPPPRERPGEIRGSLVIVGGGGLPDTVRDQFLALAGGKGARIVVIPTASLKADNPDLVKGFLYWKAQGVASVVLLHTRSREQANDPVFVKPLTDATGVWLSGGDQCRLVAAYHGTAVETELQKLLLRGGVIGGTSAGAAVMSGLMIRGGNPSAEVGPGFDLLPGVVVDMHFLNRNRLNRLLGVLAKYPYYLGLGIDEQTAAVIHGRILTVLGNANVRICLAGLDHKPASVTVLRPSERVDLIDLIRDATTRSPGSEPDRAVARTQTAVPDKAHSSTAKDSRMLSYP
jgi:cyanophycinase